MSNNYITTREKELLDKYFGRIGNVCITSEYNPRDFLYFYKRLPDYHEGKNVDLVPNKDAALSFINSQINKENKNGINIDLACRFSKPVRAKFFTSTARVLFSCVKELNSQGIDVQHICFKCDYTNEVENATDKYPDLEILSNVFKNNIAEFDINAIILLDERIIELFRDR